MVLFDVFLKPVELCKRSITTLAPIRTFTRMLEEMSNQGVVMTKLDTTFVTFILLLGLMNLKSKIVGLMNILKKILV